MKNIFIGFLLIFLDFNFNIGASKIGLIPDFLGYIVMIKGLDEMSVESNMFEKVRPFAVIMAVYTGILYLSDLFGITASLGILSILLGITATIISLYISYNIVMGVKDVEMIYSTSLNGDSLKTAWTILAVMNIITFLFLLIPPLAVVSIIVSFIVAICFLFAFNRSKNMYYEMKAY